MVDALMHSRYDQFGKQMARITLEIDCEIDTDAEAVADARRVDLFFVPRQERAPGLERLGLLGRISRSAGTFEFFHNTPTGEELADCLIKHGNFRHFVSRRTTPPPTPTQWVISSGRPNSGIEGLRLYPLAGWPTGIYEGPPLLWTRLVVVSELPATRETLLMRLLGAGAVLRKAIAELQALPADAIERTKVLPILVRLRLAVPSNPAKQTSDDQEFLMDTEDVVEAWRQEAIQEGVHQGVRQGLELGVRQGLEQGLELGERKLLLRMLRRRFGSQIDGQIERRVADASTAQIELWAERVLTVTTLAELLAD